MKNNKELKYGINFTTLNAEVLFSFKKEEKSLINYSTNRRQKMNLKNLFKLSTIVFLFSLVISSFSYGQGTIYYVDVVNGLDGYNGLSQTVTGTPGVGPKQTIMNAIAAASAGDVISVAYANGNLYNEIVTVTKKLYFRSTGGTPNVYSLVVNNATAAGTTQADSEIFDSGTFNLTQYLTLTIGKIRGASNITVATLVTRTAGTVDSQLNYDGVVNFTYDGGAAITTGLELPAAGDATHFGNLITTGGGTALTFNSNKTINGTINAAGTIDLGTYNITVKGNTTFAGNVTNGTLTFQLAGNRTQTGAVTLPTIIINSDATARTIAFAATTIDDITINNKAVPTFTAATTVGNVTNNSTGLATLTAATNSGSLINTYYGGIVLGAVAGLAVDGDVLNSGEGSVDLTASTAAVTVSGVVTNNPTIDVENGGVGYVLGDNVGCIIFPNQANVIDGLVTNAPIFTGTTTAATAHANIGEIRFLNTGTLITLTGGVKVNATISALVAGTTNTLGLTNCGNVVFSNTTGGISIVGGITNTTVLPATSGVTFTQVGSFVAILRTSGKLGTSTSDRIGPIAISSSTGTAGNSGNIITAATTNAGFFGTSITLTGGKGGIITLANETVNISGNVVSNKTVTGTYLAFGTAATATVTVTIGGNLENDGSSDIVFMAFNGAVAENFAVTGKLISTGGGAIKINPLSALTGTGTITLGSTDIQDGTVSFVGAGAAVMDVVINGTASFTGGVFDMSTSSAFTFAVLATTPVDMVTNAATDRVLQLGGLTNIFGSPTASTDFSTNANVVLLVQPSSIVAAQTVTGNAAQTVWPGWLVVKNPTGLQPAVTFNGGNLRILKSVAFDLSQVKIDGMTLFIGGQLAPNNGAGDFYNHPGYITANYGFISMNGDAAAAIGGAGSFGNFEVDMVTQTATVAAATGAFTGTFNLTAGSVAGGATVIFNNTNPYPTIVVNAGTFAVAPTFTSMVNVYYIGIDKTTGNELPAATTKLNDLTVATTNSAPGGVSGKGTVDVNVPTTVNGTLTILPNQAFLLNGVDLTMKGATAVIDGVLANKVAGDLLILARTGGTAITGSGWLPDVNIAVGSLNNSITGIKGHITTYLGANDVWGTDDFNTATTQATGDVTFLAGAGQLTVNYGTGAGTTAAGKTNFNTLTTAHASNLFTLAGNAKATSNLVHPKGQINVADYTLTFLGTAHTMTEGATIIGAGTLNFTPVGAATFTTTGTTTANGPVIGVTNFEIDVTNANLQIPAASDDLYVTGNLYLLGGANSLDIDTGVLYAQGPLVSIESGCTVISTTNTGILYSNIATGVQTLEAAGAVTIENLTVDGNLLLHFTGATPSLTITRGFVHNSGELNFGAYNLTIATTGTFDRVDGTYAATSGYMIIRTATFNQGDTNFTIPNLQFGLASDAINVAFGDLGIVTVTGALGLDINTANTVTHTVTSAPRLAVANGASVEFYEGKFDVAPTFGATMDLYLYNTVAIPAMSATVWPATATLVQTLTVDNALACTIPGSRQVNNTIYLAAGTVDVPTGKTLTLVDNGLMQVKNGFITLTGSGAMAYGNDITLKYVPAAAYVSTGEEIPEIVKDLIFTRLTNITNKLVTLPVGFPITVTGNMTINNNLTANSAITLNGNLSVGKDAFTSATNPVLTFNAAIIFAGDQNTTITLPATAGVTLGNITINKTNSQNTIELLGGNLVMAVGAVIDFQSGLIKTTGNYYVQIDTPVLAGGTAAQGFTRNVVEGGLSHVVGLVRKTIKAGIIETFGRNEFPVGSLLAYCPVAITTLNPGANVSLGVNVTAGYSTTAPAGFNGLPIVNGVAVGSDIARYAQFHWSLKTDVSMGNTKFDLELTSPGFEDYDDLNNVRIIRRMGVLADATNSWTLQGTQYNNYVSSGIPTVTNVQTYQGLNTAGAIFTYGMKSRLTTVPFADQTIGSVGGVLQSVSVPVAGHFTSPTGSALTYTASSTNAAVASVPATITGGNVVITGVSNGACDIVVRATDENNDFTTLNIHVVVNSLVGIDNNAVPTEFGLSQNYPNPFNPTTAIRYALPSESHVTIRVYNMLAQEVATLVNEVKSAGYHTINFNASGLASGRYIAVIKAGDFNKTIKMNLLK